MSCMSDHDIKSLGVLTYITDPGLSGSHQYTIIVAKHTPLWQRLRRKAWSAYYHWSILTNQNDRCSGHGLTSDELMCWCSCYWWGGGGGLGGGG